MDITFTFCVFIIFYGFFIYRSVHHDVKESTYFKQSECVLHDKYRTLWYRTNDKKMYDSARKYGLICDSLNHFNADSIIKIVDTVPVK